MIYEWQAVRYHLQFMHNNGSVLCGIVMKAPQVVPGVVSGE